MLAQLSIIDLLLKGPEKLLEVWFSSSHGALPDSASPNGLKKISADTWKDMLDLVNCKILSVITYGDVDAYLLSESSMFIFPHKLVLKTCGTTTLLYGLPRILELAALEAGFPHVPANTALDRPAAAIPYRIFYSRKNFQYPDRQRGPHRSWQSEVKYLDQHFANGSAYMIGKMNGEHWYLYFTAPDTRLTPPATPKIPAMKSDGVVDENASYSEFKHDNVLYKGSTGEQDYTLEILMTDLDEDKAGKFWLSEAIAIAKERYECRSNKSRGVSEDKYDSIFGHLKKTDSELGEHIRRRRQSNDQYATSSDDSETADSFRLTDDLTTEGHTLGNLIAEASGLVDIYPQSRYPNAQIDSYLFEPCGFSANGVVPTMYGSSETSDTHYFTIHVTPERHCSYASFETNVPVKQRDRDTSEIIDHVISIFRPGRFSVTLFEGKVDARDGEVDGRLGDETRAKRSDCMDSVEGYRRVERIFHDLDDYDLVFRYYERLDWKGGAPRLGEFMC